jgi:hypothetical protein
MSESYPVIVHMLALAARMEEEGQYNLAAAACNDGQSVAPGGLPAKLPSDKAGLVGEVRELTRALSTLAVEAPIGLFFATLADSMPTAGCPSSKTF